VLSGIMTGQRIVPFVLLSRRHIGGCDHGALRGITAGPFVGDGVDSANATIDEAERTWVRPSSDCQRMWSRRYNSLFVWFFNKKL
jgi:hypothetical protein